MSKSKNKVISATEALIKYGSFPEYCRTLTQHPAEHSGLSKARGLERL
jgi:hypothetical protein